VRVSAEDVEIRTGAKLKTILTRPTKLERWVARLGLTTVKHVAWAD